MNKPRIILDTNVFASYILKPSAGMTHVVHSALYHGNLLISQDTFNELRNVIERFVKRGFVTIQEASEFLGSIVETAEWIKILETIQACRDPNDDKFLELAVSGQASYLVTGDQDLLIMRHFRETRILSPKDFVEIFITPQ